MPILVVCSKRYLHAGHSKSVKSSRRSGALFDPIAFPAAISSTDIFICGSAGDETIVPALASAKTMAKEVLKKAPLLTQPPLRRMDSERVRQPFYLNFGPTSVSMALRFPKNGSGNGGK